LHDQARRAGTGSDHHIGGPHAGGSDQCSLANDLAEDLHALILQGIDRRILADAERTPGSLDASAVSFGPLYRHPRKILGIGLNYRDHAADLNAPYPTEPASFMKCDNTIIGPGDAIELPAQSERVTAEAELGVIIGRNCRDISEQQALDYIAGYCLILDMTAEDILQKNPRFLTRSKNFDTFFFVRAGIDHDG
jgi:2-keto-4-pentenoate hydratase/2-oxohepta-3-ene-1,7-dioic acid hydratase in catechol pathway